MESENRESSLFEKSFLKIDNSSPSIGHLSDNSLFFDNNLFLEILKESSKNIENSENKKETTTNSYKITDSLSPIGKIKLIHYKKKKNNIFFIDKNFYYYFSVISELTYPQLLTLKAICNVYLEKVFNFSIIEFSGYAINIIKKYGRDDFECAWNEIYMNNYNNPNSNNLLKKTKLFFIKVNNTLYKKTPKDFITKTIKYIISEFGFFVENEIKKKFFYYSHENVVYNFLKIALDIKKDLKYFETQLNNPRWSELKTLAKTFTREYQNKIINIIDIIDINILVCHSNRLINQIYN